MSDMFQPALDWAERGFAVFPCSPSAREGVGKAPLVECDKDANGEKVPGTGGLYKATRDREQIISWWTRWPNAAIGIRTGREAGVWAIDPDVPKKSGDPDGLAALAELERQYGPLPATHTHLTPSGGRHLLFRWREDRPVTNREGRLPANINVRGNGGYLIAPPSRRSDGRRYEIAEPLDFCRFAEAPEWLYDLICEPKQEKPANVVPLERSSAPAHLDRYAARAFEEECRAVASSGQGRRNNQLNASAFSLGTLAAAGVLQPDLVREELLRAATASGLPRTEAVRTIASGLGSGLLKPRELPANQNGEAGQWVSAGLQPALHPAPVLIKASPFVWINPLLIPRRRWIYGHHYIRQFVGVTVAPGGVGKSSLGIVEALAMATGKPLLDVTPTERARVWLWNGEDPLEELQRRVLAAMQHYDLMPEEVNGWLFLDSGRTTEIVVAEQTRSGITVNAPVREALIRTIQENAIDVVMIDPFVSSHRVTENDNNGIDRVAKLWSGIADETNCAIDLVHHARKTGGAEVTMEDGRGAVALLSAARSGRVLNSMTEQEAAGAGVESPRSFFRVDNGKANLAPPPNKATWHQLVSVDLVNGDRVAVVASWKRKDPLEGVTVSDLRAAQSEVNTGRWREHPSAHRWVGQPIARALKLNLEKAPDLAKVKGLLRIWIETGMFRVVSEKDDKGKDKKFVEVGEWAND
ncbi:bifunctional DNA primase/polymerase [Methylobacterium nigriterrae]|uniref:bifunctional DNA primase/polymerase n=1 Tax=Methylobacterium nigriterrae TaxID=3127512 RepID=UPI00301375B6